jgi:hypothetical protein
MAFKLRSQSSVKKGGFKSMGSSPLKMHEGKPHSNDFVYGDWKEVSREVDDAGVTTISERRSGERDVEYSKRGVNWDVGYKNWLAAGNKGTLADFKIEANRWKKSQTRTETDVQNRQRMLEAQKQEELKQMDSKPATTIKLPAGSTTKDKNIIVSKPSNTGGKKGGGKSNVSVSKDSKKQSGTVGKTIKKKNPGSGPPPPPPPKKEPRTSINNTRYLKTESASTQGKENKFIQTFTELDNIKYPEGGGDDSYTTSVTTRAFKPKIFGKGLRKRGRETSSSETLIPDGKGGVRRKSYTYSTHKIKR